MFRYELRIPHLLAAGIALLVVSTSGLAQTFIGPTAYLSKNDSPFLASINAGTTFLETFESGALATPGVTTSAGAVFGPSGITDSVDADDGVIDGSGTGGHSFFSGDGAGGITFTFSAAVLGHLPTQVGIVWTDGAGTTLFEAFGPGGVPLGQIGPVAIADGTFSGTTAEDRFFGVTNPGGISSIRISNTSGGIEVDHLQYGLFGAAPAAAIDLPTTSQTALLLLALLMAAFAWRALAKRRVG
jgi:IPTL-CTERM motif